MQLNPRIALLQFGHLLQQHLFPRLEEEVGPLSPELKLLTSVVSVAPPARHISGRRARTGRPAKDRTALATAFIAKAILNLDTTRSLINRLKADAALRQFCGWKSEKSIPHESKFSRAFAEFAHYELPQQLHASVIADTQAQRLIGHIARDSTAIEARERFAKEADGQQEDTGNKSEQEQEQEKPSKQLKQKRPKGSFLKAKASERGTRIQQQRNQKLSVMLANLPRVCDIGVKTNSKGHQYYWRGYKLHLDVADGQVPVSALLTSASVHDSQVAIPLMTMTGERVTHLYELMDSAYDAADILAHSRQLQHVPIVAPNGRRKTRKPSQLPKVYPAQDVPEMTPAQKSRFKERTMVERVNARLKDEFGATQIRVRGAAKVMAHLMFGVLALTVDQWLKLSG